LKPLKVAISTVGCRANQADSAALLSRLDRRRVLLCAESEPSDIVIINTCTVTAEADRDCRKRARRALGVSPNATVFLIGCAVNVNPSFGEDVDPRIQSLPFEQGMPEALAARLNAIASADEEDGDSSDFGLTDRLLGRTRGLLKIQNGCSHGCSYCIVPKARGRERSMPVSEVMSEIDRFKDAGFKELVITGVQLGAWGRDLGLPSGLGALLVSAAERFAPGRIRLSSVEPWSIDDSLLEAVLHHGSICPHLHLPLQNGDDNILNAMRRGYDSAVYLRIADKIRKLNADAALGTDVILGFPGEDEAAYQNTVAVLKSLSPSYLHAFTFSPRQGTRAATMDGRPDKEIARQRTRKIRLLSESFSLAFRQAHIGRTCEVIAEEERGDALFALTDTFVRVRLAKQAARPGELVSVRITGANEEFAEGVIAS
jgi:threonylcarbamoyladenosine tRNA methylthiotransferase MtaB